MEFAKVNSKYVALPIIIIVLAGIIFLIIEFIQYQDNDIPGTVPESSYFKTVKTKVDEFGNLSWNPQKFYGIKNLIKDSKNDNLLNSNQSEDLLKLLENKYLKQLRDTTMVYCRSGKVYKEIKNIEDELVLFKSNYKLEVKKPLQWIANYKNAIWQASQCGDFSRKEVYDQNKAKNYSETLNSMKKKELIRENQFIINLLDNSLTDLSRQNFLKESVNKYESDTLWYLKCDCSEEFGFNEYYLDHCLKTKNLYDSLNEVAKKQAIVNGLN